MDDRTWLGWPVWLVTVIMLIAAMGAIAGPVGVVLVLGTASAMVVYAQAAQARWSRRRETHRDGPPRAEAGAGATDGSEATTPPMPDRAGGRVGPAAGTEPRQEEADQPTPP